MYYHTFQKNEIDSGIPIELVQDKKALMADMADFLRDFKKLEAFNLTYLESILPIRYCFILPRNYAALFFALYVNAIAQENRLSFIDCFRNIDLVNARFTEPTLEREESIPLNPEFQETFKAIFERRLSIWTMTMTVGRKTPAGVFYLINAEMKVPEIIQRFNVTLLFDLEIFVDPKHNFHAFLNFGDGLSKEISEGIVFFANKKKIRNEQDIDLFYMSDIGSVKSARLHWKPDAHIAGVKMKKIRPHLQKMQEKEIVIMSEDARILIERHNPKILNKIEYKTFKSTIQYQSTRKSACDLTKEFSLFLPRESISIPNYFLNMNLMGPRIGRFYPPDTLAYIMIKRRLFLYNLVGPFRDIIGLPKRKKRDGEVQFYTPEGHPEIPMETIEVLKNYATPSQVLYKIVQNAEQNQGDIEKSLIYIRGLYRASRKIALMLKNKQFDLITKIVARYMQ